MARKPDKRIRLICAAKKLIYYKGFYQTTLADIAAEANIPLGNVYYYFKTKGLIAEEVIKELSEDTIEFFEKLNMVAL